MNPPMPAPGQNPSLHEAWIELPDQRTFILNGDCHFGRIEGNEIVNPDSRISRRHSVVRRQGNAFVLVDLGSTNGTFLNDSRIYKPTRLKDGDVIMVGNLRYTFCQRVESTEVDTDESAASRTVVAVAKISCWLLLVSVPEELAAESWGAEVRQALAAAGAGVRRLRGAGCFAHWRDRKAAPENVRAAILEIGRRPAPAGVRLALHHGAVRIGPAANPGEESLLGADVTFTHKLEETAAALGVHFLASEPAVLSLGLGGEVRTLGPTAVRDIPGTHALFTL